MRSTVALAFAALSLAACNGASPGSASTSSSAAPASPIAGWSEVSLAASGPAWKGWFVKGPPGATAKMSVDGLEIAKDKTGIGVSFTNLSLDKTAMEVKEGVNYDQKPAILLQTKELLEWSSTYKDAGGMKTMFGFHLLVKTSGVTMGCKQAFGVFEREKLEPLEAACRTLVKR